MSAYETIGYFYVIFATTLTTAAAILCAGIGAQSLYRTYKAGSEKAELERLVK